MLLLASFTCLDACCCHGLRLPVFNKEPTYLLTLLILLFQYSVAQRRPIVLLCTLSQTRSIVSLRRSQHCSGAAAAHDCRVCRPILCVTIVWQSRVGLLNASYMMKSKVFQLADDKIVKVKTTNSQTVVIIRNKYARLPDDCNTKNWSFTYYFCLQVNSCWHYSNVSWWITSTVPFRN